MTPDALVLPPIPADESEEGALAEIRNRMTALHMYSPLYETDDQADQTTRELFGHADVRAHLEHELQLDAEAVLRLTDAVAALIVRGYEAAMPATRERRTWLGNGDRFSFTPAALAAAAGVGEEQAQRFAQRFALSFDGTPLGFAELTTRARHRPLVRDGERLLPISIPGLRRILRGSLTALLNPDLPAAGRGDSHAFNVYSRERGGWLERKALDVLREGLRPDWIDASVYFTLPNGDKGEIDVLLRLGDTLIPVQAKAGAARVHLTLEDLAAVGSQPWLLADAGFSEDRELPWIVNIGQLELLLEYFENAPLFLHFLTRRLRANLNGQLIAHDEIDWAVRYGEDALRWAETAPGHPDSEARFGVPDEHDEFDRWQLARQAGERVKRPRPDIPPALRRMLEMIDRSRPRGWDDFCLALLDLPEPQRLDVIKLWQRQMRSDRAKPADLLAVPIPVGGKVDQGFAVLREERLPHPDGEAIIRRYCEEQLRENAARRWFAIAAPFDQKGRVRWTVGVFDGANTSQSDIFDM